MEKDRFFVVWGVKRAVKVALFAVLAVAALALFSFVVMSLWNVLMPEIFGLHAITFWQAIGLLVLSKLLFGRFRPFPAGGPRFRRRMFERMTPEQREKFRQGLRRGCGVPEAEAQA